MLCLNLKSSQKIWIDYRSNGYDCRVEMEFAAISAPLMGAEVRLHFYVNGVRVSGASDVLTIPLGMAANVEVEVSSETIVNVTVHILEWKGTSLKVGIEAPRELYISRSESEYAPA